MLPSKVTSPKGLSKRLLWQMAANCRRKIPLQTAIAHWEEHMNSRINRNASKGFGRPQPRRTKHVLPVDVEGLNSIFNDEQKGRRTNELFFPDLKEDRLELQPFVSSNRPLALKPTYNLQSTPNTKSRKRKRQQDQSTTIHRSDNHAKNNHHEVTERITSKNGQWEMKKVRNHSIRQPAKQTELERDIPSNSQDSPQIAPPSAQPKEDVTLVISSDSDGDSDCNSYSHSKSDSNNEDSGESNKEDRPVSCEGWLTIERVA